MKKKKKCPTCGKKLDPVNALGHILLAHGPPTPPDAKRRRRVRSRLPRLHRRLEEKGFSEEQAHLILQLVAEEFRNTGVI